MQLSAKQTQLALGLIVIVVIVLAFVIWKRSAPPNPQLASGQGTKSPFGSQASTANGGPQAPAPRPPSRANPSNSTPFSNEEFLRRAPGRTAP